MISTKKKAKKILYGLIVGLSCFSALMIISAWYASSIAPKLMQRNYLSVQYAMQMERSFVSIFVAESGGAQLDNSQIQNFETNLNLAQNNITEDGEKTILLELDAKWKQFKNKTVTPTIDEFQKMLATINSLIQINEGGMYLFRDRAKSLGLTVVSFGVLGLALSVIYAIIAANDLLSNSFGEEIPNLADLSNNLSI